MSANPDGLWMPRAELHEHVVRMKSEGMTFKQIAERLGRAVSSITDAYYDPTGEQERERKRRRKGTCVDCGADTFNSGSEPPKRCSDCVQWTREGVLLAFQEWADENGGIPPSCTNLRIGGTGLPHSKTVKRLFGSWNEGLVAAGFDLRCDRRPETWEAMLAAVRAGERVVDIAERFGITREAVYMRFRTRGMSVAAERPAWWQSERDRERGSDER